MKNNPSSGRRILVVRNSALGDVAMTVPVIYSAAREYPEVEFWVLTSPFFSRLFVNAPQNVKLIKADLKKDYRGAAGMLRLLRHLDTYGFTDVADLHDVVRSWLIDAYFKLKGLNVSRLDKDRRGRRRLIKHKEQQKPYAQRYAEVFEHLGLPVKLEFESLYGRAVPECKEPVHHPAIGIAPFARYSTKEYPLEALEDAIRQLPSDYTVYLFGGKADKTELDRLAEQIVHERKSRQGTACELRNLAGLYSIEEELKIMANMDVMVTMDSANQHLASLTGTRAITLWGSTVPYGGFLAYNQQPEDALCANLPCQPCTVAGSKECKLKIGTSCMLKLSPQMLVQKIIQAVNSRHSNERIR